jgi:hypothetical protein
LRDHVCGYLVWFVGLLESSVFGWDCCRERTRKWDAQRRNICTPPVVGARGTLDRGVDHSSSQK